MVGAVVVVLEAARSRIAKGWIQKDWRARNPEGNTVAWCLSGAVTGDGEANAHRGTTGQCAECDAMDLIRTVIGGIDPPKWNDAPERTQAEVLAALDRAIVLAKAAQP